MKHPKMTNNIVGKFPEMKNDLEASENQPDATALTENEINWLQIPKIIKGIF